MSNTLLLMSDEHNQFYSSVYGHPSIQTPNMARLAEAGAVYENAYCPSPLCMPCRSAFMSGRRVHQIQTYSNCSVNVDRSIPTYGGVLADQNIHTVHAGKSHVFAAPEDLGFTQTLATGAFDTTGDTAHRRNPLQIRPAAAQRADGFGPHEQAERTDRGIVDAAVEWLTTHAPTVDCPWVLSVNINNPHFPHYTTQELWDLYPEGGDLPDYGPDSDSANHPRARDLRDHFETDQFTEPQTRGLRRGYLACITFVDQQLGRLIDALKASGQFEDTNIIYTADHGEMLGKFGMWWKCSMYEDAVRIPCVAAGPDFRQGARIVTPVDLHDVQAGIFDAAGAERPEDWIGRPLQQIPDYDPMRVIFSEYHGHGARSSSYMIRQGKWKYIHHVNAPHQLFDLKNDPSELHNVYDMRPEIGEMLEGYVYQICDPDQENERTEQFIEAQLAAVGG